MLPLYTPITESEAAVISSLLEAYDIPFFIRGAGFSKLYPGLQISHYNTQTFMVAEAHYELARSLIADFLTPIPTTSESSHMSLGNKLRIILETLIGGWFVPGKK